MGRTVIMERGFFFFFLCVFYSFLKGKRGLRKNKRGGVVWEIDGKNTQRREDMRRGRGVSQGGGWCRIPHKKR
jgi:hypothetical protein